MKVLETTEIDVADLMEMIYELNEDYDDREEYRESFYEKMADRYGLRWCILTVRHLICRAVRSVFSIQYIYCAVGCVSLFAVDIVRGGSGVPLRFFL